MITLFKYIHPAYTFLLPHEIPVAPYRVGLYVGLLLMTTEILEKWKIISLEQFFSKGDTRTIGCMRGYLGNIIFPHNLIRN